MNVTLETTEMNISTQTFSVQFIPHTDHRKLGAYPRGLGAQGGGDTVDGVPTITGSLTSDNFEMPINLHVLEEETGVLVETPWGEHASYTHRGQRWNSNPHCTDHTLSFYPHKRNIFYYNYISY